MAEQMAPTLTVLSAQSRPVAWDAAATLEKLEGLVRMHRRVFPQVDLYLFPELFLTGDDPWTLGPPDFLHRVAEKIPGPLTEWLGALAAKTRRWLCAGSVAERAGRKLHNTALCSTPRAGWWCGTGRSSRGCRTREWIVG